MGTEKGVGDVRDKGVRPKHGPLCLIKRDVDPVKAGRGVVGNVNVSVGVL